MNEKENKAFELSDEQLEQVSGGEVLGGMVLASYCPVCTILLGRWIFFYYEQEEEIRNKTVKCPSCNWQGTVLCSDEKKSYLVGN